MLEVNTIDVQQDQQNVPEDILADPNSQRNDEDFNQIPTGFNILNIQDEHELIYDQSPEYTEYLHIDHSTNISDVSDAEQQESLPRTPRPNYSYPTIREQFYIRIDAQPGEHEICSRLKSLYSDTITQELDYLKHITGRIEQLMDTIIHTVQDIRNLI